MWLRRRQVLYWAQVPYGFSWRRPRRRMVIGVPTIVNWFNFSVTSHGFVNRRPASRGMQREGADGEATSECFGVSALRNSETEVVGFSRFAVKTNKSKLARTRRTARRVRGRLPAPCIKETAPARRQSQLRPFASSRHIAADPCLWAWSMKSRVDILAAFYRNSFCGLF
jgi:hypothetical protein